MKNWLSILTVLAILCTISCKKDDDYSGPLGGDTDLESNQIGYQYSGSLRIGDTYVNSDLKAVVISSEDGIIDVKGTGTLPSNLKSLIPSPYSSVSGVVNLTGKFANTSEGIGYVNAEGEQSVLVRYDAKVGDKWSYTTKGGKQITRKVTAKSTDDDFPYGFMMIKVVSVEQNLPYPGFTKAVYHANHKFGLVAVELFLEDGTSMAVSL